MKEIELNLSNETNIFLAGKSQPILDWTDKRDFESLVGRIRNTIFQKRQKHEGEPIIIKVSITEQNSALETFAVLTTSLASGEATRIIFIEANGTETELGFNTPIKKDAP